MGTNYTILRKGLKQLGLLLFLLIAAPICLTLSFKALFFYKEGLEHTMSIIFLVISSILMLFALFYAFKTFRTLLNSLFQDN